MLVASDPDRVKKIKKCFTCRTTYSICFKSARNSSVSPSDPEVWKTLDNMVFSSKPCGVEVRADIFERIDDFGNQKCDREYNQKCSVKEKSEQTK